MQKYYTTNAPRYRIQSLEGNVFDVFNRKPNAIKKAVKLATDFPGNTFVVKRVVLLEETDVFSFKIESQAELSDLKDMYEGVIATFQNKLKKTKSWRKSNGPSK